MLTKMPQLMAAMAIGLALGCAGMLDHMAGPEIFLLPVYFVPVAIAGAMLGRSAAIVSATLAAGVYTIVQSYDGQAYSQIYMWLINTLAYGAAFAAVGLLSTALRAGHKREYELRRIDVLTGLANRPSFYERAASTLALCKRNMRTISLACIDLDNFKHANDTVGAKKGDAMLMAVAKELTASLRASDIVARFGGDSFVLLLPEAGSKDVRNVLDKIRTRLNALPELSAGSVTVSIGAIAYTHAPADLQAMVTAAESALAEAKAEGKNRVHIQNAAATVF